MKIGLFAGTFDPIHNGHIEFAKTAIAEAKIDKIIIIAEKEPYRKKPQTSWDHRQAMVARATEPLNQVDHDYQFASELARNHTMKDMLITAKRHYGPDYEYWFLVGSDIFEHMHLWHDFVSKPDYGGFIVSLRSDHTIEWLEKQKHTIIQNHGPVNLRIVTNPRPHISSSKIRHLISDNQKVGDISPRVAEYIAAHNLYQ